MNEGEQNNSKPASFQDLITLIDALNRKGVPYMLVGGYSMILHGFSRGTRDIDILFPAKEDVGRDLVSVLLLLGEEDAKDIDPKWFEEGENIRFSNSYVLDIMLNANGQTYESMLPFKCEVDINGLKVNVPSLEGMIKTKMTLREKDAIDRMFLERALQKNQHQEPASIAQSIFKRLKNLLTGVGCENRRAEENILHDDAIKPQRSDKPRG